jgi:uncharacterized protein with von Willebrand factor type A (vWA) domain
MFLNFFFQLRAHGLKVSPTEWLTLLQAVARGYDRADLRVFYGLARSILVKREGHYDAFDRAFAAAFEGIDQRLPISDELLAWLQEPLPPKELSDAELQQLKAMDTDTLRQQLEERLKEQKERHDGGSHWVGTGGTSPFGQGGQNPAGLKVGDAGGGGRSAVAQASERRFQNLRSDRVLDTRSIGAALRRLRKLARETGPDELDIDESIDRSAREAEIELVFRPPKKNRVKLLLLIDVGGSMDPWAQLCERLFSAAHQASHFAQKKTYFFHNCVYDKLYTDIGRDIGVPTADVLKDIDGTWTVIFVGDAWMSPHELQFDGNYFSFNKVKTPGIEQLRRFATRGKAAAWLNPEPQRIWNAPSVKAIRRVVPMFELTLDGLDRAVDHLRGAKPVTV